jgi:hypothetical protein
VVGTVAASVLRALAVWSLAVARSTLDVWADALEATPQGSRLRGTMDSGQ